MKWTVTLSTFCVVLAGCNAAGEPGGAKRFSDAAVPFTFEIPADFTKADVDRGNTRGEVLAAVGISKVDVLAVRRASDVVVIGDAAAGARHEVLGHHVTSELHPVEGFTGWVLECQYTSEERRKVREACRRAVATVRPK